MKSLTSNEKPNILWLLDPGHGIDTKGKRSPIWQGGWQLLEYQYNRNIVNYLISMLTAGGYDYRNIVPELIDIPLSERVLRANRYARVHNYLKCMYISIHGNAAGIEKASGIEVFTSPGQTKSDEIATIFFKRAQVLGWRMRFDYSDNDPDKESRFTVLTKTTMPAILTETGFYTNQKECKKMIKPSCQIKIASVHYQMIKEIERSNIL